MNFRLTAILFAVVLVLVGGLLISTLTDDAPATDGLLLAPLEAVKPADIDRVELAIGDAPPLVFTRAGKDRWTAVGARLDATQVNKLITDLLKLKPALSKSLTGDAKLHGLDTPGVTVVLAGGDKSAKLLVGDSTIGGDRAETFVATGDRPGVPLAVRQSDLAALFKDGAKDGHSADLAKPLAQWRLRKLLGVEMYNAIDTAQRLKITTGGAELTVARVDQGWRFTRPAGYGSVDLNGPGRTRSPACGRFWPRSTHSPWLARQTSSRIPGRSKTTAWTPPTRTPWKWKWCTKMAPRTCSGSGRW
jgi:hypothetical protein